MGALLRLLVAVAISGLGGAICGAIAFIVVFYSPAPFVGLKSMVAYGWITMIPALCVGVLAFAWSAAKIGRRLNL